MDRCILNRLKFTSFPIFVLCVSFLAMLFVAPTTIHATNITLTGSQNSDLSANLSWSLSNNTDNSDYSYQLQQTDSNTGKTTTVGTKDSIKVLNISPWNTSDPQYASLKTWMETDGYGQGKISVDTVQINDFSQNANKYLKDSNGNYKYDTIVFGFEDSNGYEGLSTDASNDVKDFAKTGRGVLMGHDTMMSWAYKNVTNLDGTTTSVINSLDFPFSSELNVYLGNYYSDEETHIKLIKNGYLLNYPNIVGKVGDVLTIPKSHNCGQIPIDNNDSWADFVSDASETPLTDSATHTVDNGYSDGIYTSQNGYDQYSYLFSHNNWAMIQTGHSNGQATTDEQKLIANTLFYLGQVTSATSFTTHTSQDVSAPDTPTMTTIYNEAAHTVTLNNLISNDNGNKYEYQILGTNLNDNSVVKSNDLSLECKTGVKKYVYRIDADKNGSASLTDSEVSNGQSLSLPKNGQNYYLHVAAVDGNNNISSSSTYFIDGTPPDLNVTNTDLQTVTHSAESLNLKATDSDSGVDSIQTPDGTWHSGDSVSYQVTKNGTYSFVAKDKAGNTTTKSITVSNIYPDTFVQNANDTQVSEQDQAQTSSFSDSVSLNGRQQLFNPTSSDWLVGNSSGTGWILSVSAPALSNGSHKLSNALSMKAPVYSGGNLHNLLGNNYQLLSDDDTAVAVYQNKPTTFTWTHSTGTWYLRVNSYVRDQRYSVSNIRLTEQGSTTNLLQNSDGPFTPDGSSILANSPSDPTTVDNYTYYENSTVHLEQGKTYTLSAQSNGVIGGDHYKYLTDRSNTNNHTVIWLASAPASNVENEIVSDDDTDSTKTSDLQLNDGSTYQVKVPANAYAGTYTTQIKWSVK